MAVKKAMRNEVVSSSMSGVVSTGKQGASQPSTGPRDSHGQGAPERNVQRAHAEARPSPCRLQNCLAGAGRLPLPAGVG